MGNNYYIRRKVKDEDLQEINDLVKDKYWSKLASVISNVSENSYIHLGLSACGWRFCFQYYDEYGPKDQITVQTIYDLIDREVAKGAEIVDEYNELKTVEEFKDWVESKQRNPLNTPHEPSRYNFTSKDGYDWSSGDFS